MHGAQLADVERVDGATVWVRVRLDKGGSAGPYRCQFLEGPAAVDPITSGTVVADHGAHTHAVTAPAALVRGDRVLVVFVSADADRPIVVGRVASA